MRPRIVQCMINFVRCTKFDSYQTRSPPFGRLMLSKGEAGGMAGEEGEGRAVAHVRAGGLRGRCVRRQGRGALRSRRWSSASLDCALARAVIRPYT
jgi:hypothetical protein